MSTGSGAETLAEALTGIDDALSKGDAAAALQLADHALRRWPDEAEIHHARGVALRSLDRGEDALEEFRLAAELAPDLADAWLDAGELLLDELDDPVAALEILDEALDGLEQASQRAEAHLLRGIALARLEDFSGALRALGKSKELQPAHPDVAAERGSVLIELLRLDEAEEALREAVGMSPDDARAHHLLGFALDYSGRRDEAGEHFRRAAELDPEESPCPPRLTEAEFDGALEAALREVPEPFRARLANVEIGVENYATREFCRRHDCSPTTLGIYVGTPVPLRSEVGPEGPPDRIVLFQRAIENSCRDADDVTREIGVTLRHEIGHLLGFSEDELHERGHG